MSNFANDTIKEIYDAIEMLPGYVVVNGRFVYMRVSVSMGRHGDAVVFIENGTKVGAYLHIDDTVYVCGDAPDMDAAKELGADMARMWGKDAEWVRWDEQM